MTIAAPSIPASTCREYKITRADLPLCCPMPDMTLWNAHPRVYLPIEKTLTGKVICPYCGSSYILTDHCASADQNA